MASASSKNDGVARIASSYIGTSDDMCFEVFYQIRNGSLSVKALLPDQREITIVSRTGLEVTEWERIAHPLPSYPYYRLFMEAAQYDYGEFAFVAVDDISIKPCSEGIVQGTIHLLGKIYFIIL